MKRYIYILLLLVQTGSSFAQLTTTLVVSAAPPGTLSEWGNRKEVFTLIVFNSQGSAPGQALVKTVIRSADGSTVGTTNLAKATVFSFPAGNTILNAAQAVPLENMIFNGRYKSSLERTGKLPAENYTICVQLVTPADFIPLTGEKCRNFILAAQQLPIAVMPLNGAVLNATAAQTAITFRWTPLTPVTQLVPTYRVQVFEVLQGQKPMQAFRSNPPLLDKEVRGTTQYIWRPQLGDWCTNCTDSIMLPKTFIWTIQTTDQLGAPVGDGNVNGDGRAEPIVFSVQPGSTKRVIKNKKAD